MQQTRQLIDRYAPLILAGYIGYIQYKRKPNDWQTIGITVGIVFLASKMIIPAVSKDILGMISKPSSVDTATPITSDIMLLTDRLYEDIYEVMGTRDSKLYEQLATISSDRLKAVYNDWLDRYYYRDKEDLISAMEGETYFFGTKTNANTIISRLKSLTK